MSKKRKVAPADDETVSVKTLLCSCVISVTTSWRCQRQNKNNADVKMLTSNLTWDPMEGVTKKSISDVNPHDVKILTPRRTYRNSGSRYEDGTREKSTRTGPHPQICFCISQPQKRVKILSHSEVDKIAKIVEDAKLDQVREKFGTSPESRMLSSFEMFCHAQASFS